MRIHRPPGRPGIVGHIGIGIQLVEEFLERSDSRSEDERLIAIVAGAPVALAERAGHGQLRHFLAIAEDAEFCFAGEDFFAADQTRLAAAKGDTIVLHDALARELSTDLLRLLRCRHCCAESPPRKWVAAGKNRNTGKTEFRISNEELRMKKTESFLNSSFEIRNSSFRSRLGPTRS